MGTEIPGGETIQTLHCHHQNNFCIKMGSDESMFSVSFIVRGKVTRVSLNHNLFGEQKQAVKPLSSAWMPYC